MIIQANDSFSSGKSQSYSLGGKTGLVVHKAPFSATVAEFTQKYGGIGVGPWACTISLQYLWNGAR